MTLLGSRPLPLLTFVFAKRIQIMTDAELDNLCKQFKATRKHVLDPKVFFDCGKVMELKRLIDEAKSQGKRLLVFSMFTQVLDIIKRVLDEWEIKWVKLTGDTKVDERQSLVDEFSNDDSITVFLLSTLAGGMGINLTAASVVVMCVLAVIVHRCLSLLTLIL